MPVSNSRLDRRLKNAVFFIRGERPIPVYNPHSARQRVNRTDDDLGYLSNRSNGLASVDSEMPDIIPVLPSGRAIVESQSFIHFE